MSLGLCKSCETPLKGKYCYVCGEKVIHPEKEYSLLHHTEEFIEGFFHFDNKFFRSVKLLVTKPGFLTAEYLEGRRVGYIKPLHLFLVLALVIAFVPARFTFLSQSLPTMQSYPDVLINKTLPEKVRAKKQWDYQVLKENFKKDFDNLSKPFSVLFIFILALFFWPVSGFKRKYFTENVVSAIHFYCFILIVVVGFFFLIQVMMWMHLDSWVSWLDSNDRAVVLFLFLFGWYCYHLFRKVYSLPKWRAVLSSLLIFVFTMISLLLLRASFYHLIMYKYLW